MQGEPLDPQKNIIPSSDNDVAEIISTEANYDRWSNFLFPHSKSSDIYGRRKKQREVKLPDGRVAESMIEVIPAQDEKSYTTKTYDVFLALNALWKEKNMPDEPMSLFLSDIAKKLDLKPSGKALNSILEELRCLEETKISWVFSFRTKANTEETYKGQRVLSIFNYVKIKERSSGMSVSGKCTVRFSDHIMQNYRLYNSFALYYSENLIRRAIGEYKELVELGTVKNKQGYFTAIVHTLCHKLNKKRIKTCDKNCKYRPENQLFPDN